MELSVERNKIYGAGAFLVIILGFFLVNGFTTLEADSTCQKTVHKCHGLPLDSCIGVGSKNTDIVDKSSCPAVSDIAEKCNSIGARLCEDNSPEIGTRWSTKAKVYGQKCSKWDDEYSLKLESC